MLGIVVDPVREARRAALQALGGLLGFESTSHFTEQWLDDTENANGPEYRELIAQRFQKLQRIMHDGESPQPDTLQGHSSAACTGTPPRLLQAYRAMLCCTPAAR